jgi:translation initiation factor 4A
MREQRHTVDVIHSELPQEQRHQVVEAFKAGSSRVLIASGILARGVDVQGLSLVVNFDLPRDREEYLHRVGRVGRYGRKGVAINFVTQRDAGVMREIEEHYSLAVEALPDDLASLAGGA